MRIVYLIAGSVIVFLLGGYVDHQYDWPFGPLDAYFAPPLPSAAAGIGPGNASAYVPSYSRAQGAQDAPRNDIAAGGSVDLKRCVATMVLRKESESEAKTVCEKIVNGIGG